MSQLDFEIVLRKLKNIKKYIDQLQTKSQLSQADYDADFEQQLIVERLLYLLIESAIDVNTHIIVSSSQSLPETYQTSFLTLGEMSVISAELAMEITPSAGLRDHLVHGYDDLDSEIVRQAIAIALNLFPQYLQQVQSYLKDTES